MLKECFYINEIQRVTKSGTVSLAVKIQHIMSTFNNVMVQNNIENRGGVFVSNILWTIAGMGWSCDMKAIIVLSWGG